MTTDVETEWQLFMSGKLEAAAKCCGFKRVGLPPGGQKRSFWWAQEVQLTVKEKEAAFNNLLGKKEPYTRVRYVKVGNAAAKEVGNAKTE
ncbi:unnamed protein product [Soboliphyme baturini]|uniref:Cauli_VI domain-containing protein n=1 Tax=Soboliphyme baturini TaxID=241478 RepID=A0A183ILK4_9BILA|nr:unnamed protein product [Soboliphyme baturini]